MDLYVESGMKKLRCGYTTGSTATAAAKAATMMLFNSTEINKVTINTPKGIQLNLNIHKKEVGDDFVKCSVLKDGGDDIDATHGLEIWAKAEQCDDEFILVGGIGVGVVTKPGLYVVPGEAAINPVPRKMIEREVRSVLPTGKGVKITILVPKGEEIAKKTFNPRLGIVGGISILGTTGIVYPMSEDAIKESINIEIKQKALTSNHLVLTFGNMGERLCVELGYSKDIMVIISNFVGFAIESCVSYGVKKITFVGHIGKISKVAYGCFNTHSRISDVRLEVLGLEMALLGYDIELVKQVISQKTSEGAVRLLGEGHENLYDTIKSKIKSRVEEYCYNALSCEVIMYYDQSNPKVL